MTFTAMGDIADAIRQMVLEGLHPSVHLATVVLPFAPSDPAAVAASAAVVGSSPLVQIAYQPGNRPGEARCAYLGAGPLAGVLTPLLVGTEVLVLIPEDQPHHAVILGAFHSAKNPLPPTWTGLNFRLQHPLGGELRSAEGLPADGIVMGNFLVQFQTWLIALNALLGTISPPPSGLATYTTAVAPLLAALAASTAFVDPDSGGVGGAPLASTLWRITT